MVLGGSLAVRRCTPVSAALGDIRGARDPDRTEFGDPEEAQFVFGRMATAGRGVRDCGKLRDGARRPGAKGIFSGRTRKLRRDHGGSRDARAARGWRPAILDGRGASRGGGAPDPSFPRARTPGERGCEGLGMFGYGGSLNTAQPQ